MALKRGGWTGRLGLATIACTAAAACASVAPRGDVHEASGRLTSLRVEEAAEQGGTTGEVVLQLDSEPSKRFGFHLGSGRHRAARQGMLDLLGDAIATDSPVTIGYTIEPGRPEGVVVRTSLARQPETSATVRVLEVPQFPRTADDPIVQGLRPDPRAILASLPDPPADSADKGAHELMEETEWTLAEERELAPGEAQETTVTFEEPVLLQARASWFGSPGPVEMTATMGGATVGTGAAHAVPPDRGTLTLAVEIHGPGSATVAVVNRGASPVRVETVAGVVPLSLLEE